MAARNVPANSLKGLQKHRGLIQDADEHLNSVVSGLRAQGEMISGQWREYIRTNSQSAAQAHREQQRAQAAWQNATNEILDTFGEISSALDQFSAYAPAISWIASLLHRFWSWTGLAAAILVLGLGLGFFGAKGLATTGCKCMQGYGRKETDMVQHLWRVSTYTRMSYRQCVPGGHSLAHRTCLALSLLYSGKQPRLWSLVHLRLFCTQSMATGSSVP